MQQIGLPMTLSNSTPPLTVHITSHEDMTVLSCECLCFDMDFWSLAAVTTAALKCYSALLKASVTPTAATAALSTSHSSLSRAPHPPRLTTPPREHGSAPVSVSSPAAILQQHDAAAVAPNASTSGPATTPHPPARESRRSSGLQPPAVELQRQEFASQLEPPHTSTPPMRRRRFSVSRTQNHSTEQGQQQSSTRSSDASRLSASLERSPRPPPRTPSTPRSRRRSGVGIGHAASPDTHTSCGSTPQRAAFAHAPTATSSSSSPSSSSVDHTKQRMAEGAGERADVRSPQRSKTARGAGVDEGLYWPLVPFEALAPVLADSDPIHHQLVQQQWRRLVQPPDRTLPIPYPRFFLDTRSRRHGACRSFRVSRSSMAMFTALLVLPEGVELSDQRVRRVACLSMFAVAAAFVTQQDEFALAVEAGVREGSGPKHTLGPLSQPVPLRVNLAEATSFMDVFLQVATQTSFNKQHATVPCVNENGSALMNNPPVLVGAQCA